MNPINWDTDISWSRTPVYLRWADSESDESVIILIASSDLFHFIRAANTFHHISNIGGRVNFPVRKIEINSTSELWGPFSFQFPINSSATANDGALPYGTVISDVTVSAYDGIIDGKNTIADEIQITDLIEVGYTTISGTDTITIRLQYPVVTSFKGSEATIIFDLTLDGGQEQRFFYHYIDIQ